MYKTIGGISVILLLASCGAQTVSSASSQGPTPPQKIDDSGAEAPRVVTPGEPMIHFSTVPDGVAVSLNACALTPGQVVRIQHSMAALSPVYKEIYTKPEFSLVYTVADEQRHLSVFVRESFVYQGPYLDAWGERMRGRTAAGYALTDEVRRLLRQIEVEQCGVDSCPSGEGGHEASAQSSSDFFNLWPRLRQPDADMETAVQQMATPLAALFWGKDTVAEFKGNMQPPPWRDVSRVVAQRITSTAKFFQYTPFLPIGADGFIVVGGAQSKYHPQPQLWAIRMIYRDGKWEYDKRLLHDYENDYPGTKERCPNGSAQQVTAQGTMTVGDVDGDGADEAAILYCPNHCGENHCHFNTRVAVLNLGPAISVALKAAAQPEGTPFSDAEFYQVKMEFSDKNGDNRVPQLLIRFEQTTANEGSHSTRRHSYSQQFSWDAPTDSYKRRGSSQSFAFSTTGQ